MSLSPRPRFSGADIRPSPVSSSDTSPEGVNFKVRAGGAQEDGLYFEYVFPLIFDLPSLVEPS